jgi:hypothetical protein
MSFGSSPAAGGEEPKTVPFEGCGILDNSVDCLIFAGDDGTNLALPFLVPFEVGDHVRVIGEICPKCPSPCPDSQSFNMQSISDCDFVDACGTLAYHGVLPDLCIVLEAVDGNVYLFENLDVFDVGDSVRITGQLAGDKCPLPGNCGPIDGCIPGNTISACGELIDECGTLVPGGGLPFFCINFQTDAGFIYSIENIGAWGIGNRVRISGTTTAPCGTFCGPIDGCLAGNTIIGCPDIDQTGVVDVSDLLAVIAAWGSCPTQCPEDLDLDGQISVNDLLVVLQSWT